MKSLKRHNCRKILFKAKTQIYTILVLLAISLNGCAQIPSPEEYGESGIGLSIEKLKAIGSRPGSYESRIGWKEVTYQLDNGNWVYVEPLSKRCLMHWEVTPKGIIVGYRIEGTRCY